MSGTAIDLVPSSFLAELLRMDHLPAYVIDDRVWTDRIHSHRGGEAARVEIRRPSDVDLLLDDARRCAFECPGRLTVARIDAARRSEMAALRRLVVGGAR